MPFEVDGHLLFLLAMFILQVAYLWLLEGCKIWRTLKSPVEPQTSNMPYVTLCLTRSN
jgi:hypothetical protein